MTDQLLAIAAYGDWHPGVPAGKVLVLATNQGKRGPKERRRKFHVDDREYWRKDAPRPFVIDPTKHTEVT